MNPLQSTVGAAFPGGVMRAHPFAAARGPVFARPPTDGFDPGGGGTGLARSTSPQLVARERRLREYLGHTGGVGHSFAKRARDVAVKDFPWLVLSGLLVVPWCVVAMTTAMFSASALGLGRRGALAMDSMDFGLQAILLGTGLLGRKWLDAFQHWTSDDRAIEKLRDPATPSYLAWQFYTRLRDGYGGLSPQQRVAFSTAILARVRAVHWESGNFGGFDGNVFLDWAIFAPGKNREFLFTVAPEAFERMLIDEATAMPVSARSTTAAKAIADLLPEFSPANCGQAIEALFSHVVFEARGGPFFDNIGSCRSLGTYAQVNGDEALLTRLITFLTESKQFEKYPFDSRLRALEIAYRYFRMSGGAGPLTENDRNRATLVVAALRKWSRDASVGYPDRWKYGDYVAIRCRGFERWADELSAQCLRSLG